MKVGLIIVCLGGGEQRRKEGKGGMERRWVRCGDVARRVALPVGRVSCRSEHSPQQDKCVSVASTRT